MDREQEARAALLKARAAVDDSRNHIASERVQISKDRVQLRNARRASRDGDDTIAREERALRQREANLRDARQTARDAKAGYRKALDAWLGERANAEQDFARLSASYPILLMPVRIETRFITDEPPGELRVRIYPDEIAADSHEVAITEVERTAGEEFWRQGWNPADELAAWQGLLAKCTQARAAWVVLSTQPTNVGQRSAGAPIFGPATTTDSGWTRAAHARLLPDRWVIVCFRGGVEVKRAVTSAVSDPLALTLSPSTDAADPAEVVDISGDGLNVDRDVLWTLDFATAEAAGMAVRIPLGQADVLAGFERIVVTGVKGSLDVDEGAHRLARLFDAHHYGRSLALLSQGMPTNNLSGRPAAYPPQDATGSVSFAVERGPALATPQTSGAQLASALGIKASTFDHVSRAGMREQTHAEAMNTLLWPAAWGYFLEQWMHPAVDPELQREIEQHFVQFVRGRGPLPLFRVGGTPYGVLPVSSLRTWRTEGDKSPVASRLPTILQALYPTWKAAAATAPRIGRSDDPDRDLVEVLEHDASAREVWVRSVYGPDFARNLAAYVGADIGPLRSFNDSLKDRLEQTFGESAAKARGVEAMFADRSYRFAEGLVTEGPVSETDPPDFNYLAWMRPPTTLAAVRAEQFPAAATPPRSLLYRMARHGLLLYYKSVGLDIAIKAGVELAEARVERELVQIVPGTDDRATSWSVLAKKIPGVTGERTLMEYLPIAAAGHRAATAGRAAGPRRPAIPTPPEVIPLAEYLDAIETLERVPSAELERLFTETLDCCASRLDAWITSLVTQRLAAMRAAKPAGVHVGAFGWVEDVIADRASRHHVVGAHDSQRRLVQNASGGYIHAPSMDHAAAAAVLRSAYITRSGDAQAQFSLDLSSNRVRTARWLLASAREGQPLTALLGYGFERSLHDAHLDKFIEPLRLRYPLPQVAEAISTDTGESISARDVVDGRALRIAWRERSIPFSALTSPGPSDAEIALLSTALDTLDATLDAVADLLTADSIFQLVRGTTSAAAASLDALASDARPPEGDIARTPRGGTALTHRVVVTLGGAPVNAPGWNAIGETERSLTEKHVDRWVGSLLGPAGNIRIPVRLAAPTLANPDATRDVAITLDALGLRPLDFLALVPTGGAVVSGALALEPHDDGAIAKASELERRIASVALAGQPQEGRILIGVDRLAGWPAAALSLGEAFEIGRAIQGVLTKARALEARDLVAPEYSQKLTGADAMTAEAEARAADAAARLTAVETAVNAALAAVPVVNAGDPEPDLAPLRAALRRAAAFGITSAFPALPHAVWERAKELVDVQLAATPMDLPALRDALRRAQALGIKVDPPSIADATSTASGASTVAVAVTVQRLLGERVDARPREMRESLVSLARSVSKQLATRRQAAAAASGAAKIVGAVMGGQFPFVPRFLPGRPNELTTALTFGPQLGATTADKRRWLSQAEQVRTPLRAWRRLSLYTRSLGTGPAIFDLAQLPHASTARWIGLPFAQEADRPPSGRVSLALFRAASPAATDAWSGLVIDEWPEIIPAKQEMTGVSFHYDDPGAEAPQTLLLAVPPQRVDQWSLATLLDVLNETLDLAKIRAVHNEGLEGLGQLLPALYLATNVRQDTVSTDFSKVRAEPARVLYTEG